MKINPKRCTFVLGIICTKGVETLKTLLLRRRKLAIIYNYLTEKKNILNTFDYS